MVSTRRSPSRSTSGARQGRRDKPHEREHADDGAGQEGRDAEGLRIDGDDRQRRCRIPARRRTRSRPGPRPRGASRTAGACCPPGGGDLSPAQDRAEVVRRAAPATSGSSSGGHRPARGPLEELVGDVGVAHEPGPVQVGADDVTRDCSFGAVAVPDPRPAPGPAGRRPVPERGATGVVLVAGEAVATQESGSVGRFGRQFADRPLWAGGWSRCR